MQVRDNLSQASLLTQDLGFVLPKDTALATVEQPAIEPWQLIVAVADLTDYPVSVVKIVATAGRFYHLDYTPYRKPDPDLVLMTGENNEEFNRLVKRLLLLRLRQVRLNPQEWLKMTRPYLDTFLGILEKVEAWPDERRLAMSWVTGIVCQMK